MARLSKAMLDDYIEIATRKLHEALSAWNNKFYNTDHTARFLKVHGLTKLVSDIGKLNEKRSQVDDDIRDKLCSASEEYDKQRARIRKEEREAKQEIDNALAALRNQLEERLGTYGSSYERAARHWAKENDPTPKLIEDKIQEITDTIRLSQAPEDIVAFVKSLNADSFLKDISRPKQKKAA